MRVRVRMGMVGLPLIIMGACLLRKLVRLWLLLPPGVCLRLLPRTSTWVREGVMVSMRVRVMCEE